MPHEYPDGGDHRVGSDHVDHDHDRALRPAPCALRPAPCALRKALKEAEALLLALVPVVQALSKVRTAWRQTRRPQREDIGEEETRRALP
ncbi:hypothetical protein [Streptomyces gramineus]|uniref:hypothetical protein n=1 Tax=Streptomyces gramineus TaxID=910542 RepID=UPI00398B954F